MTGMNPAHVASGRPVTRALAVFMAAALAGAPGITRACSTCKCADNTITLFGTEKPFSGRFRVALDYYLRSESTGAGISEQSVDETRATLGVAYSLDPDWTLALQVPYVRKELESATLARQKASGLGDIDLTLRWVAHRSGGVSGRHLAGLRGGLRLDSADEVKRNGVLLDIDVQPDAGATAPNLTAWYNYFHFPWFMNLSVTYFTFGEGNQDFQPGDTWLASALAQYGLSQTLALQAGLDARRSDKNEFSGIQDPDSGGTLAMAFAGVAVRIGEELLFHAGYQSPVVENLHGEQDEDDAFRIGLAYDF